jgi:hypothetical protein
MNSLTQLSPAQLRQAADIQEQIEALKAELDQVLAVEVVGSAPSVAAEPARKGRKRFSARTRAKMAAAQRARWAAKRGGVARPIEVESEATPAAAPENPRKKRKLSAQGLANIRAGVAKRMAKKTRRRLERQKSPPSSPRRSR